MSFHLIVIKNRLNIKNIILISLFFGKKTISLETIFGYFIEFKNVYRAINSIFMPLAEISFYIPEISIHPAN